MTASWRRRLTRNSEAPWLFETFFIAAVASFLGIRWFLVATGYPRIGSNGLHIAHMLWGGLLMLLALLLLLGFVDRSVEHVGSVIAGLGFGTFIDEIGKFITADNDYFYRPAVALVYIAFVGAFLVARAFVGRRQLTETEAIANALRGLAGAGGTRLEPDDHDRIASLLKLADPSDPGTALIGRYLGLRTEAPDHPTLFGTARARLAGLYEALMASPWSERVLTVIVVAYALLAIISVGIVVASASNNAQTDAITAAVVAQLMSTVAGAVLVVVGAIRLPSSRVGAFRWMLRGVLAWILVSQVFVFYTSQLAGLGGLLVDLVAYGGLRYALARELARG